MSRQFPEITENAWAGVVAFMNGELARRYNTIFFRTRAFARIRVVRRMRIWARRAMKRVWANTVDRIVTALAADTRLIAYARPYTLAKRLRHSGGTRGMTYRDSYHDVQYRVREQI